MDSPADNKQRVRRTKYIIFIPYSQCVINENQQKCDARGKEMISFFFPSSCHPLRWFFGRFQPINRFIILKL